MRKKQKWTSFGKANEDGYLVNYSSKEEKEKAIGRIGDKSFIQDENGKKKSNWSKFKMHKYTSYSSEEFRKQLKDFRDNVMTEEERKVIDLKMLEEIVCAPYNLHQERLHEGRLQELNMNGLGMFKVFKKRAQNLVYQRVLGQKGLSYDMEVMKARQKAMGFDNHPEVVADWLIDNREDIVGYIKDKVDNETKSDNAE